MNEPCRLSWKEQVNLLRKRGMKIDNKSGDILKNISYYKIKEFARPFLVNENGEPNYDGVEFSKIIKRYYQDKNLRFNLLHAIEQIEVSLKTKTAYVLGEYGAYGYLSFDKWTNKKKYSKQEIEQKQEIFKKQLLKLVNKSRLYDLKNNKNLDSHGFPTVWLAMDITMFGMLGTILSIMSNKNLKKISECYGCSIKELLSWIKCLNFIRNVCAHNSNIIDIRLKTVPMIRKNWKSNLYIVKNSDRLTVTINRLSIVIYIIVTLVNSINNKYKWDNIQNNLWNLCDGNQSRANLMGFVNANGAINLKNLSKSILK